jgi:NitT/TauT family transport system ATP-binding protein
VAAQPGFERKGRIMTVEVVVDRVTKVFHGPTGAVKALDGVSFGASGHSFTSLIGPSGCGKSTLLNILARIEQATSGKAAITHDGKPAKLGYVFQSPRLLPWRTVMENMLFIQTSVNDSVRDRCRNYLEMVGLEKVQKSFPGQLSGGMQQRVGIARAFSIEPHVLLMDEPFSHLDAISAQQLRGELHKMWAMTKKAVVFVTHDVGEAVELSDRVVVLSKGGHLQDIVEIDLPYPRNPADDAVAMIKADLLSRFENWREEIVAS